MRRLKERAGDAWKALRGAPDRPVDYDPERAMKWLSSLYERSLDGFRHYYVLRERQLKDELASGKEGKDYWTLYGQLEELKHLQSHSKSMYLTLEKLEGGKKRK